MKKKVKKFAESCTGDMRLYTVDVRKNTDISREIEKRTGVMHESPQVLILKKGRVVWHASHWDITLMALKEAIK